MIDGEYLSYMLQNSSSSNFMKTLQKEEEARLQKEKERLERERLQKEKEPNLLIEEHTIFLMHPQICDKDVNVCVENLKSVIGPQQYTQNNKDTPSKKKVIENL
jgi:hypothetical protein